MAFNAGLDVEVGLLLPVYMTVVGDGATVDIMTDVDCVGLLAPELDEVGDEVGDVVESGLPDDTDDNTRLALLDV